MKTLNRSEIFKNAWKLVKAEGLTLSAALKRAWAWANKIVGTLYTSVKLTVGKVDGGFEVSFGYDSDYVYAIKELSNRTWNAENKTWFVGESSESEIAKIVDLPYMMGKNNSANAKRVFLKELRFQIRNAA